MITHLIIFYGTIALTLDRNATAAAVATDEQQIKYEGSGSVKFAFYVRHGISADADTFAAVLAK
jgi:hypothetical protein